MKKLFLLLGLLSITFIQSGDLKRSTSNLSEYVQPQRTGIEAAILRNSASGDTDAVIRQLGELTEMHLCTINTAGEPAQRLEIFKPLFRIYTQAAATALDSQRITLAFHLYLNAGLLLCKNPTYVQADSQLISSYEMVLANAFALAQFRRQALIQRLLKSNASARDMVKGLSDFDKSVTTLLITIAAGNPKDGNLFQVFIGRAIHASNRMIQKAQHLPTEQLRAVINYGNVFVQHKLPHDLQRAIVS